MPYELCCLTLQEFKQTPFEFKMLKVGINSSYMCDAIDPFFEKKIAKDVVKCMGT